MLAPFTPFPSDEFCQSLAAEFNQSETAVVVRRADGPGYALRWFSPTTEVDLCGAFAAALACCASHELSPGCAGHATLAAAHALISEQAAQLPLSFHTRSGELKVARDAKTSTLLELDFPAGAPTAPPAAAVAPLAAALAAALAPGAEAALQADIQWLGRAEAVGDLVVLLSSEAAVRALAPNFEKLAQLGGRGVVVTAPSPSPAADYDYVCRCFFPAMGIPEDPVTGSAQCALGPFWAARLGRSELRARQVSARVGDIAVAVQPDGSRVKLAGKATTIVRGEMVVHY